MMRKRSVWRKTGIGMLVLTLILSMTGVATASPIDNVDLIHNNPDVERFVVNSTGNPGGYNHIDGGRIDFYYVLVSGTLADQSGVDTLMTGAKQLWTSDKQWMPTVDFRKVANAQSATASTKIIVRINRNGTYSGSNNDGFAAVVDGYAFDYMDGSINQATLTLYKPFWDTGFSTAEKKAIIAHEIGHTLGLGHFYSSDSKKNTVLMYPEIFPGTFVSHAPTTHDWNGANFVRHVPWYHSPVDGYIYRRIGRDGNAFRLQTGWFQQDTAPTWYFFMGSNKPNHPLASLVQSDWVLDVKWYFFDANGKMVMGFRDVGGVIYYFREPGENPVGGMFTGWKYVSGNWYYLRQATDSFATDLPEGGMLKSRSAYIVNKTYHFNASGVCTNP